MSLVSFLIPLCLKPHCDSLSCELSNLILRLLMLKYIIISDVSEDFTALITALNQIGESPLNHPSCASSFGAGEKFSFRPECAQSSARPRRCRRRRAPGEAAAPCLLFVYPLLVCVAFRPARETIASTGSAAGQEQSKKRLCLQKPQPSFSAQLAPATGAQREG